jgi:hypothetical protein
MNLECTEHGNIFNGARGLDCTGRFVERHEEFGQIKQRSLISPNCLAVALENRTKDARDKHNGPIGLGTGG